MDWQWVDALVGFVTGVVAGGAFGWAFGKGRRVRLSVRLTDDAPKGKTLPCYCEIPGKTCPAHGKGA